MYFWKHHTHIGCYDGEMLRHFEGVLNYLEDMLAERIAVVRALTGVAWTSSVRIEPTSGELVVTKFLAELFERMGSLRGQPRGARRVYVRSWKGTHNGERVIP